jgi:diketogulonate reductase-like aldo/keto reductase
MYTITAQNAEIPAIGFGTWRLRGPECRDAVANALETGYRHVDTAAHYDNHEAVGAGIDDAAVDRDDLFVTTKVPGFALGAADLRETVQRSLDELGLSYVDLLLIHWPDDAVPIEETIGAMNDLQMEGAVRHIGVSQFSVPRLQAAIDASSTPIVTNQVEYHPYYQQTTFKDETVDVDVDLFEFCADRDIFVTAYSPLGVGEVLDDETIREIADRHDRSPAQVVLRWHLQEGRCAIPKAASEDHQRENLAVFDFELDDDELAAIDDCSGSLTYYLFHDDGPVRRARVKLGAALYSARDAVVASRPSFASRGD